MNEVAQAFEIFSAQGGAYFLHLVTLVAVIYGIAWVSWRIGQHLANEKQRVESAKDIAIGQLVEELREQHTKCQERVAQLEERVRGLEARELVLQEQNAALNDLVVSLRRHLILDSEGAA